MKPILSEAIKLTSGSGLVHDLFTVFVVAVCVGLIWALGWGAHRLFKLPALALQIWNAFFILIGSVILLNFLLGLIGHGFIAY